MAPSEQRPELAPSDDEHPGTAGEPVHALGRLFKPERSEVLAMIAFAGSIGILMLATPIAVQAIVNSVALGGLLQPLIVIALLLLVLLGFAAALFGIQTWVVEMIQRRIWVRTVAQIGARIPYMQPGAGGPELVNRYFDLFTIQKSVAKLLIDALGIVLGIVVGLSVLAFYHPLLLAFDVVLLIAIGLIVFAPLRWGERSAVRESTAKYAMAGWLETAAADPETYRERERHFTDRTNDLAQGWLAARAQHFRLLFSQLVGALGLQVLASVTLLGIGGYLVIKESLSLGQLVAAELIVTLIVSGVAKMGKHLEHWYDLKAATEKVGQLLDTPTIDTGVRRPDRLDLPASSEVVRTRPGRKLAGLLGLLVVATPVALAFVPWQQNVPGTGRVIALDPEERVRTIVAPVTGRVIEVAVREGARVEKGDVLARMQDQDPNFFLVLQQQLDFAQDKVEASHQQLEVFDQQLITLEKLMLTEIGSATASLRGAVADVTKAEREREAQRAVVQQARIEFETLERAKERRVVSEIDFQAAKNEYKTAREKEAALDAEVERALAEVEEKTLLIEQVEQSNESDINDVESKREKAKTELAAAKKELNEAETALRRQETQTITSPVDGAILSVAGATNDELISRGAPLIQVVPDTDDLATELRLRGIDAPLVQVGRKARLQFEGWPAVQVAGWPSVAVGTFGGVVSAIDAQAGPDGRVRVLVTPDPDADPWPDTRYLRQGVLASGWVQLETVSAGYEIWRILNAFPPSIEEAPATVGPVDSKADAASASKKP